MAALGNASSVPSEQGARDDVDEAAGDQPGGVPGERWVLLGVEIAFRLEEQDLDVVDELLFFFGGDVHGDGAEGDFDLVGGPTVGVEDGVFERLDPSEAVAGWFAVGPSVAADESGVRAVGRDAVQSIRQVRQHEVVG